MPDEPFPAGGYHHDRSALGLTTHTYGQRGPRVIVLHGGPGAPGSMAPVARGLADEFRVLEPFQRRSEGAGPLTVARHAEDLHQLVMTLRRDEVRAEGAEPAHEDRTPTAPDPVAPPALVGSSWGAMLALVYAAAYPADSGPIVLIGCGTFDEASRARLQATLEARTTQAMRRRMTRLTGEIHDEDERLRRIGDLLQPLYSFSPPDDADGTTGSKPEDDARIEPWCDARVEPRCDARGHRETWQDMLRLQAEGELPAAFQRIRSPVLMLHGTHDPHPGAMIRDSLMTHLPQLEYHEWERCGHYPWLEPTVRDAFFALLREWLRARCA